MKKFFASLALLTAVAAAVGLFIALTVGSRMGGGVSLADLPANSALIATVDVHSLREKPAARELLASLASLRPRGCAVDPAVEVDGIALALDAGVGRLGPFNAVVLARGSLHAEALSACLPVPTSAASAAGVPDVHFHDTYVATEGLPFVAPQVHALRGGVLVAPAAFMPSALATAEHRAPGADQNATMHDGLAVLGRGAAIALVWDAHAPIPNAGGAFGAPLAPLSFALGSPVSISFGLTPAREGAHVQFVWRYATSDEATRANTMLGMLWAQSRGVLSAAITQGEYALLESLRAQSARSPALAAPTAQVQQGFVALNAAVERARWRADGNALRLEFDWSEQELSAALGGLSAGIAVQRTLAN